MNKKKLKQILEGINMGKESNEKEGKYERSPTLELIILMLEAILEDNKE